MNRIIFVFGSNLAGIHGAGAALYAAEFYDAKRGVGEGRTGMAYAIPTKDENFNVRSLEDIKLSVEKFAEHARMNPSDSFLFTAIGTGYAGIHPDAIADIVLGADMPENVFISAKLYNNL